MVSFLKLFDSRLLESGRIRVHHRHCRPRSRRRLSLLPSRRATPGTTHSSPPSGLTSGLLERGGRRAPSSSSRGLVATPPECGDSHTLSSSPVFPYGQYLMYLVAHQRKPRESPIGFRLVLNQYARLGLKYPHGS